MKLKIIAVRPLKGCDRAYRKVLNDGIEYTFYNDRQEMKSLLDDFYKIGDIEVSISAIVGKNGSGKSSLVELMLRIINNFYFHFGPQELSDVSFIPNLHAELIFEVKERYKILAGPDSTDVSKLVDGEWIPLTKKQVQSLEFFYTIVVNYSHYAYNQIDFAPEGPWIKKLFHKNDGYQTPIVLNPYREDGVIDINNENDLMRARLLSNLVQPTQKRTQRGFYAIRDGLEVRKISLILNKNKLNKGLYEEVDLASTTSDKVVFREVNFNDLKISRDKLLYELQKQTSIKFNELAELYYPVVDYVIYKLVNISVKYRDFEVYFSKEKKDFRYEDFKVYLTKLLKEDGSHIGFKIKQALNLLRYKHFELRNQQIDLEMFAQNVQRTATKARRKNRKNFRLIEFLPPAIFKVDILLSARRDFDVTFPKGKVLNSRAKSEMVYFSQLSSGEKQRIFATSSITYHLFNLDSIDKTANRRPYRHVNVVLEEIELYFHPEMQRQFIDDLIWAIGNIHLEKVKSINFLLVTHSPFILSDIPSSNILFLNKLGVPHDAPIENTFGGNIHDLLAESFFLDKGLIGEFARKKIEGAIQLLQPDGRGRRLGKNRMIKLEQQIEIIGEPFLRNKLLEMFDDKFRTRKEKLINELKRKLKELETTP